MKALIVSRFDISTCHIVVGLFAPASKLNEYRNRCVTNAPVLLSTESPRLLGVASLHLRQAKQGGQNGAVCCGGRDEPPCWFFRVRKKDRFRGGFSNVGMERRRGEKISNDGVSAAGSGNGISSRRLYRIGFLRPLLH